MRTTRNNTAANPMNLPMMIIPRLIGFDSMRYIVLPSISRAMSHPARSSTTARPESSKNERPKSIITRLFSPRANESSPSDRAIRIIERNIISEKKSISDHLTECIECNTKHTNK